MNYNFFNRKKEKRKNPKKKLDNQINRIISGKNPTILLEEEKEEIPTKSNWALGFINHYIKSFKSNINFLKNNINQIIIKIILITLFGFCAYLLLFDRIFLVKNLKVYYPKGSYLSLTDTKKLKKSLESSYFSIIAKNQFWFVNPITLADLNPNIENIEITERTFPDSITLRVTTKPIIATLAFNNNQFWRVDKEGNFVTEDDIGLNESVINIKNTLIWNKQNNQLANFNLKNIDNQLDRLYFVRFTKAIINNLGFIFDFASIDTLDDTQVKITIDNETVLIFDANTLSIANHNNKTTTTLNNSRTWNDIKSNKINYIDFRIPDNVYICKKNTKC